MELDTGAAKLCLISTGLYEAKCSHMRFSKTNVILKTYTEKFLQPEYESMGEIEQTES